MKTRSALLKDKHKLVIEDRSIELKEDEVLIKAIQSSICDADLRAYRGLHMPEDLPPFDYLGHEGGGIVEKVGEKVREFSPGDRVMLFGPHASFSTYYKAPVQNLHHVPDGMDMKIASLGEPIAVGMFAVSETNVQLGDVVAVVGLNFQGLIAVQALKKRGASKVIAIDYSPKHLDIAAQTGADVTINTEETDALKKVKELTGNELCNAVFHSCGYWNPKAEEYFNLGVELTQDEGQIVSVPDMMSPISAGLHRIHHHAIEIKFPALMHHSPEFRQIWVPKLMRMVQQGGIDINPLITDEYSMEEVLTAMEKFDEDPDHVKIILKG